VVRFPKGRALAKTVEIARNAVPPKKTARLSRGVQVLASLCFEAGSQAGNVNDRDNDKHRNHANGNVKPRS